MILEVKTFDNLGTDLTKPHKKTCEVWYSCDYCGCEDKRRKDKLLKAREVIHKDACIGCRANKQKEVNLLKYNSVRAPIEYVPLSPEQKKRSAEKAKETKKKKYGDDWAKQLNKKTQDTITKKYGVKNCSQIEAVKHKKELKNNAKSQEDKERKEEKRRRVLKEKLGDDYIKSILNKSKNTLLENYGVEHYSQTKEFKDKRKQTCVERYGKDYEEVIKNRRRRSMREKYGVDFYSQTEEYHTKFENTCLERYGVDNPNKHQDIKDAKKKKFLEKYGVSTPLLFPDNLKKSIEARKGSFGKTQKELTEWVNSFGCQFKPDYEILAGKELDLYDSGRKLAIEYCGLFWHNEKSPTPRLRDYHYNKYKLCSDRGVRLITIFEDEWLSRNFQCRGFLLSCLGVGEKYDARKCEVRELDKSVLNDFCEQNHIQGPPKFSVVSFGLYYQNNLLQVMSLGRHHRGRAGLVLDRFCCKSGFIVRGGASKLLSKCKKWMSENGYSSLISWSDNRWSYGDVYVKLGFVLDGDLPPDYSYVDLNSPGTRKSKQSQKKKSTNCPSGLSEKQWCEIRGLAKIWDCGKKRWVLNINGGELNA